MQPTTEQDLAEVVRGVDEPIRIVGGGTRPIGEVDGVALSVAGLTGVTLYEPGALTLVAQAGTPVADIEAVLAAENQRLAFEPLDHRGLFGRGGTPTIGGMVATNASGPRRVAVGACRDHLLGVRYVDGAGQVIKNGGRVMKNVTGYDLVKLMAGSFGTLGVMTEVSLKVLPQVEAEATLVLVGLATAQAVEAMSVALGSPYEVTGAAQTSGGTALRLEGFDASVTYRVDALKAMLGKFGEIAVHEGAASTAIWRDVRDVAPLHKTKGDVWRVSVKPSDAPQVISNISPAAHLLDWGGGLIWMAVDGGRDIRPLMQDIPGHATLIRRETATGPTFHPEPAAVAALSDGLRHKFDPRGIFNPGLMA